MPPTEHLDRRSQIFRTFLNGAYPLPFEVRAPVVPPVPLWKHWTRFVADGAPRKATARWAFHDRVRLRSVFEEVWRLMMSGRVSRKMANFNCSGVRHDVKMIGQSSVRRWLEKGERGTSGDKG